MPIELHAFDTPNGRKISVVLEEMALPYIVTIVNIRKGEQFDHEFLKISPNGKIPAIVDPGGPCGKPVSIFESGSILIYLGEKTGKFWPRDPGRFQSCAIQFAVYGARGSVESSIRTFVCQTCRELLPEEIGDR